MHVSIKVRHVRIVHFLPLVPIATIVFVHHLTAYRVEYLLEVLALVLGACLLPLLADGSLLFLQSVFLCGGRVILGGLHQALVWSASAVRRRQRLFHLIIDVVKIARILSEEVHAFLVFRTGFRLEYFQNLTSRQVL